MIGFYDYTVVLTYISFTSSIIGIFCAVTGHPKWAVFCLALSGLCDMFDGKIARRKTEQRMRSSSEFRLILCVMWSVLECFRLYYAMSWACAVFTVWQF
jgi:CDP-diacylglycerol---serine O-phosphatidyltransferase